jgi:predicted RND superfamily exporter protein
LIITALAAAAVLGALGVRLLWIDSSTKSMMMLKDPDLTYYYETREKFGSDSMMIVYVEDERLFTIEKLKKLDSLVSDLSVVPGVWRSESLFSVSNLKNTEGFLDNNPLMERVPRSQEEAEAVKRTGQKRPSIFIWNWKARRVRISNAPRLEA